MSSSAHHLVDKISENGLNPQKNVKQPNCTLLFFSEAFSHIWQRPSEVEFAQLWWRCLRCYYVALTVKQTLCANKGRGMWLKASKQSTLTFWWFVSRDGLFKNVAKPSSCVCIPLSSQEVITWRIRLVVGPTWQQQCWKRLFPPRYQTTR